jgi:hypothetical protein
MLQVGAVVIAANLHVVCLHRLLLSESGLHYASLLGQAGPVSAALPTAPGLRQQRNLLEVALDLLFAFSGEQVAVELLLAHTTSRTPSGRSTSAWRSRRRVELVLSGQQQRLVDVALDRVQACP